MRLVIQYRKPSLPLRLLWAAVMLAGLALMTAIPVAIGYLWLTRRLP
jgi:hypothetical protein